LEALRDANFMINAIQGDGYEPCTIIAFEMLKKYGLHQIIAGTIEMQM